MLYIPSIPDDDILGFHLILVAQVLSCVLLLVKGVELLDSDEVEFFPSNLTNSTKVSSLVSTADTSFVQKRKTLKGRAGRRYICLFIFKICTYIFFMQKTKTN